MYRVLVPTWKVIVGSQKIPTLRRAVWEAGLALGVSLSLSACAQSGHAVDQQTGAPIADARMTLDCRRGAHVEGTETVRTVTRITDASGLYVFSSSDLAGCQFKILHGAKPGYRNVGSNDPADYLGRSIPTIEYFLVEAQAISRQLESGVAWATGTPSAQAGETPAATYARWFQYFMQAKSIAKTPSEIAYVREHYCATLSDTYERLTAADKARMLRLRSQHLENGKMIDIRTTDHEQEVVPYCGKP